MREFAHLPSALVVEFAHPPSPLLCPPGLAEFASQAYSAWLDP